MEFKKLLLETVMSVINENHRDYLSWKRKNVTIRGVKNYGQPNNVHGQFGKGLYTAFLSNKSMAREYGTVYFVLNAIPKKPKVVNDLNRAEIFMQSLVDDFCKENGVERSIRYFDENTTIEEEMLKRGYDGFVIKSREMVNYLPEDIKYFETERQLIHYYEIFVENQD